MAKNIGLVVVGDGVLNGEFKDGASTVLISELEKAGVQVSNIAISGNSSSQINSAIRDLISQGCDNIVTLGALGVDLRGHNHRSGVAQALGCITDYCPEVVSHIQQFCEKPELRAHGIQSELFVAYDTGATIPLFVNTGRYSRPITVASFSGYPDLMVNQIGAYIENVIVPKNEETPVTYPELFSSWTLDPAAIPEDGHEYVRLVESQIRNSYDFDQSQQGVDIYFDISKFTPARYAFLAASLRERNIAISSVKVCDTKSMYPSMDGEITIVVPETSEVEQLTFSSNATIDEIKALVHAIDGIAPREYRATIKTNVQLDTLQRAIQNFDVEVLGRSPMYVAVPNLDDPTTGANIEIKSDSLAAITDAITYIEQQAEINGWEIRVNNLVPPMNKVSKEQFSDSRLPRSVMDSDNKLLWPLPDNVSFEYGFLIGNSGSSDNTERAKELINKLAEIFQTQNTPGDYEFEVYKNSLGILRPVTIVAINELCVAYDLDLPDFVTPDVFEKAIGLLSKSSQHQLEKIMDPSSGISLIDPS
ncbi:MAG: molybdopterin-binding protein [Acidimicrobiia bacterium]